MVRRARCLGCWLRGFRLLNLAASSSGADPMKRLLAGALMAAAFAMPAAAQAPAPAAGQTTFVQAGRLLADPASGRVEPQKTLVIQNGRVVRIADGYVSEPGGKVVDLKDSFVLPGLIDSHVHITSE